eukprot:3125230-Rhodomonas_salina.1
MRCRDSHRACSSSQAAKASPRGSISPHHPLLCALAFQCWSVLLATPTRSPSSSPTRSPSSSHHCR